MPDEPVLSAIVKLRPNPTQQDIAKVKSHLTNAGMEVHAPFADSFSIGGSSTRFEQVFGEALAVEDELLGRSVRTKSGTLELTLDALPDDVRPIIESITFLEPFDLTPEGK